METKKSKVNTVTSKHTQTNIAVSRPIRIAHGKFKGLAKFVAIIDIVSKFSFQLVLTKYLAVNSKLIRWSVHVLLTAYLSQVLGLVTICVLLASIACIHIKGCYERRYSDKANIATYIVVTSVIGCIFATLEVYVAIGLFNATKPVRFNFLLFF